MKMAGQNLQTVSTNNPLILSKEDESHHSFPLRYRTPDEEALVRQPPKPAELNSLNTDPDPDLQLTPLKQKEQPKSLLRSQTGNSKVRHRVRFQESRSFSSESEQDISDKISKVMITDSLSHSDITQENQNNNSLSLDDNSFSNVLPPNPTNCLFFDTDSDGFTPDLMSVGVIREINQNQMHSPPNLSSDFPTKMNPQLEKYKHKSANSQPYCKNDYTSRITLPDVLKEPDASKDDYVSKEGSGMIQQKKTSKTKPSHFQVSMGSTDLYFSSSQTSSLSADPSSIDKEPSLFGQPKLHSTLHLAQKIKTLQKKRPDLTSELKKNLENKEQRNKINEKAASKVDIHSNQDLYSGLISLDVSNFELEEAAIVQKPTKVKHVKTMTPGMEPDLLEFFTEDLQKETADFTLPGIPNPVIETCKAPSLIAFDLYRHNRLWEGLPGTV